jgi:hypothetical protein
VKKIVDVFIRDKLVASYPVIVTSPEEPLSDQHFIERVKEQMRAGNYAPEDIAVARFTVR